MTTVNTTNLRELAVDLSRLLDRFAMYGDTFIPTRNGLITALDTVDTLIREIQRSRPST